MKLRAIVPALLVLALLLTGCGAEEKRELPDFTSSEYLPGYDAYRMLSQSTAHPTWHVETDSGIIINDLPYAYLSCYDETLGKAVPLCAKPDCLHNDRDCWAYKGPGGVPTVNCYDGKLYFWGSIFVPIGDHVYKRVDELYRSNPDGTERKALMSFDEDRSFLSGIAEFVTHRGRFYSIHWIPALDDEAAPYCTLEIRTAEITDREPVFETVFSKKSDYAYVNCHVLYQFCGTELYFFLPESLEEGAVSGELFVMDLMTRQCRAVASLSDVGTPQDMTVLDGQVYILCRSLSGGGEQVFRLEDGQFREVFSVPYLTAMLAEDRLVYIGPLQVSQKRFDMTVWDLEGEVVFQGPLPAGELIKNAPAEWERTPYKDPARIDVSFTGDYLYFSFSISTGRQGLSRYRLVDGQWQEELIYITSFTNNTDLPAVP